MTLHITHGMPNLYTARAHTLTHTQRLVLAVVSLQQAVHFCRSFHFQFCCYHFVDHVWYAVSVAGAAVEVAVAAATAAATADSCYCSCFAVRFGKCDRIPSSTRKYAKNVCHTYVLCATHTYTRTGPANGERHKIATRTR